MIHCFFHIVTEVSAIRAMGQLKVDVTTSWNRQGVNLEKILVSSDEFPRGGIRSSDLVSFPPRSTRIGV